MASKTATLIRKLNEVTAEGEPVWAGDARAYRLNPAAAYSTLETDGHTVPVAAEVVVVSAVTLPTWGSLGGGEETYIFPAVENTDGTITVTSWLEMDGSYRGGLDHAEALRGLGYTVAAP